VGPLLEEVLKHYGDDATLVFKHFPLGFHKQAQLAAEASMAANAQGKFWEYHDVLFQNTKALARTDLENYASQLGLDMDKFNEALDSGTYKERVQEDMALGQGAGVRGTPSIYVNGRKYDGPREGPKMIEIIDKQILKKK